MPTAEEFDAAAIQFGAVVDELRTTIGPIATGFDASTIRGGTLGPEVEALLDTSDAVVAQSIGELDVLRLTCVARADQVRAHAEAARAHQLAMDAYWVARTAWEGRLQAHSTFGEPHPGPEPARPVPPPDPPPWAEF